MAVAPDGWLGTFTPNHYDCRANTNQDREDRRYRVDFGHKSLSLVLLGLIGFPLVSSSIQLLAALLSWTFAGCDIASRSFGIHALGVDGCFARALHAHVVTAGLDSGLAATTRLLCHVYFLMRCTERSEPLYA